MWGEKAGAHRYIKTAAAAATTTTKAIVVLFKPASAAAALGGCHQPSSSHNPMGASEGWNGSLARLKVTKLRDILWKTDGSKHDMANGGK
jgi:hypothetical protein